MTQNNAPKMDEATQAAFEANVRSLAEKARWDSRKIAAWAASAASGYGKYFTAEEAHEAIRPLFEQMNAEQRERNREATAAYREDVAELRRMFPSMAKYIGR